MIPCNRPVINEVGIAQQAGTPIATWRRRDAPAFRQQVASLFTGRILIYDLAQAQAYLKGRPIPALPAGEHPDDLLNDEEAAALLDVTASTVRGYATRGYLSAGKTVYSIRVWPRSDVEERRKNAPGQGKGGGRPPGTGTGPRKAHAYEGDPRLHTAAAALREAGDTPRTHIAAALARQHGGSTRTWERLLTQVSQTP
ncbi:helix-turn-helix domain-containing protein [Streptomyces sp. MB09-01]|uniref:helix-turn-helix domain-containing protein n=1 Tax=unclassified Streptomyces TaxID=2593676 RepID=UPI0029A6DCE4|nr:helix-turn-helix domain-containing protein [Streptomyces sp. MB09-01]MDX3538603.1 helix-turn-helix domain-containing protein [Streptomyces sp. MB09-01]